MSDTLLKMRGLTINVASLTLGGGSEASVTRLKCMATATTTATHFDLQRLGNRREEIPPYKYSTPETCSAGEGLLSVRIYDVKHRGRDPTLSLQNSARRHQQNLPPLATGIGARKVGDGNDTA